MSPPPYQLGTATRPPSLGAPLLSGDFFLVRLVEVHPVKTVLQSQDKWRMSAQAVQAREVGGRGRKGTLRYLIFLPSPSVPQVMVTAPVVTASSPSKPADGLGFLSPQQPAWSQSPPKRLGSLGLFYRKVTLSVSVSNHCYAGSTT